MGDVTTNARELYNEYRFGTFSYGQKREAFEPLLFELLGRATGTTHLYDIGCGSGYLLEAYVRSVYAPALEMSTSHP
jgi:SAM-dependent methyltransferase